MVDVKRGVDALILALFVMNAVAVQGQSSQADLEIPCGAKAEVPVEGNGTGEATIEKRATRGTYPTRERAEVAARFVSCDDNEARAEAITVALQDAQDECFEDVTDTATCQRLHNTEEKVCRDGCLPIPFEGSCEVDMDSASCEEKAIVQQVPNRSSWNRSSWEIVCQYKCSVNAHTTGEGMIIECSDCSRWVTETELESEIAELEEKREKDEKEWIDKILGFVRFLAGLLANRGGGR